MGFLRIYLALCVISAHSNAIFFGWEHRGDQAVQIFFAISGFYMALVLTESYSSITTFFASRAVRIYVPYFAVLLSVCLLCCITGLTSGQWFDLAAYAQSPLERNGAASIIVAAITNVSVFFQDWLLFLKQDFGQPLGFTANFASSKSMLWHYLVIPQAWSVALELCFYVLAPFLNEFKTITLILLLTASTGLRTYLYNELGLNFDPWTYRFFPCELSTFLIGMLGYRIYAHYKDKQLRPARFNICWLYGVLLGVFLIHAWIIRHAEKMGVISYLTFFPLMIIIPALFAYSQKSRFDRYIGELSYPIYLLHHSLVPVGLMFIGWAGWNYRLFGPVVALISIGGAVLLLKCLILPVENWRRRLKKPAFPLK